MAIRLGTPSTLGSWADPPSRCGLQSPRAATLARAGWALRQEVGAGLPESASGPSHLAAAALPLPWATPEREGETCTLPTTLPRDVRAHAVGAGPGLPSADWRGVVGTAGGGAGSAEPGQVRALGRGGAGGGGRFPMVHRRGRPAPARSLAAGPPGAAAAG